MSSFAGALTGGEIMSSGEGGPKPSSKVIDAHLAVQATIRSYQVIEIEIIELQNVMTKMYFRCEVIWQPELTL